MDYIVNDQERSYLIETQKNKIKNQVIDQYIAIRKEKGLSQEKIANLTGIARTNIIRIEAKRNVPTIEVLAKLAEALDMELEVRFVKKRESADAE
ncbi:MAG: helix-turn-helix transcriptional regulator [Lachnospiraceae bacterium]|nr:helix-turn-helix transcriptional regulator [Lachnospiraceae bacterium]